MTVIYYPLLLIIGLYVPGWLLGRALGTPAGIPGAFLGSAAIVMNALLVLDAGGWRIERATLALTLLIICAGLAAIARRRRASNGSTDENPTKIPGPAAPWWLLIPAGVGLLAIVIRAAFDPLSGLDTVFRWDFLARQIFDSGDMRFYPPAAAPDFLKYGWCDGIAPLVSSLYLWSYLSLGEIATWATIPVVAAQGALVFWCVYQLAAERAGRLAGALATAVLASSSLLLWGVAMGQETAMTALALTAMFLFIERHRRNPGTHWLAWAGIAAGCGALAREYGLAFILLGTLTLWWYRTPWRRLLEFAGAALLVAGPWYLRNWVKTENPLYSYDVLSLFPFNRMHAGFLHTIREFHAIGVITSGGEILVAVLGWAGVALVLGTAAAGAKLREHAPWFVGMLVVVMLWWWSVASTAGGWAYSTRVLTPAIALGATLGGIMLARFSSKTSIAWMAVALTVLAMDAAPRSLYLNTKTALAWWTQPVLGWREFNQHARGWRAQDGWSRLTDAAEHRRILVPDVVSHAVLTGHHAHPVPLFSPALNFLFAPDAKLGPCLVRLRDERLDMRFVMFSDNAINNRFLSQYPFWRALREVRPSADVCAYLVYDLWAPEIMALSR